MAYKTFTRYWWRENSEWPDGLEPSPSRPRYTGNTFDHEADAIAACRAFNAEPKTARQRRLSLKMEFEQC